MIAAKSAPGHRNVVEWGEVNGLTPILLVHGAAANVHWWQHIGPKLGEQRRVVALDLAGHGDSDELPEYSIHAWVEDIFAILDSMRIDRVVLVGHSLGALVSMAAAAREPGRYESVIVIDPIMRFHAHPRIDDSGAIKRSGRRYFRTADEILQRFTLLPADPWTQKHLVDEVAGASIARGPLGWSWKFDPAIKDTVPVNLAWINKIDTPIHLIRGQFGLTTNDMAVELHRRVTAGYSEVEISDSGHHVPLAQPGLLVNEIINYLDREKRSSLPQDTRRMNRG